MSKKIILLFLMIGFSVIFLPSESKAAGVNEPVNLVNKATPGKGSSLQRNQRRRWRNRRWQGRKNRWERRNNRRDRRDNRRNRRNRRY